METTGLRERKKERTRAAITRAALELFARDGFTATTLAAIADAAEVAPRTVSTYFPSKDAIVFTVYGEAIERLRVRLAERTAAESVLGVVGAWSCDEAAAAVARGDDERLRQAAIARDPDLWALERRHVRPLAELLASAFADELGVARGSLEARIAGETTAVALLEANARGAAGAAPYDEALAVALGFVGAGVAALSK